MRPCSAQGTALPSVHEPIVLVDDKGHSPMLSATSPAPPLHSRGSWTARLLSRRAATSNKMVGHFLAECFRAMARRLQRRREEKRSLSGLQDFVPVVEAQIPYKRSRTMMQPALGSARRKDCPASARGRRERALSDSALSQPIHIQPACLLHDDVAAFLEKYDTHQSEAELVNFAKVQPCRHPREKMRYDLEEGPAPGPLLQARSELEAVQDEAADNTVVGKNGHIRHGVDFRIPREESETWESEEEDYEVGGFDIPLLDEYLTDEETQFSLVEPDDSQTALLDTIKEQDLVVAIASFSVGAATIQPGECLRLITKLANGSWVVRQASEKQR